MPSWGPDRTGQGRKRRHHPLLPWPTRECSALGDVVGSPCLHSLEPFFPALFSLFITECTMRQSQGMQGDALAGGTGMRSAGHLAACCSQEGLGLSCPLLPTLEPELGWQTLPGTSPEPAFQQTPPGVAGGLQVHDTPSLWFQQQSQHGRPPCLDRAAKPLCSAGTIQWLNPHQVLGPVHGGRTTVRGTVPVLRLPGEKAEMGRTDKLHDTSLTPAPESPLWVQGRPVLPGRRPVSWLTLHFSLSPHVQPPANPVGGAFHPPLVHGGLPPASLSSYVGGSPGPPAHMPPPHSLFQRSSQRAGNAA